MQRVGSPRASSVWATRAVFTIAGVGMAVSAPLVPYAKQRLAIDDATLGMVLFCLGGGSVGVMPLAGAIVGRFGSRRVILVSTIGMCLGIPALAVARSVVELGVTLAFFGGSIGLLDVAMNVHAVAVERGVDRPLMSGFHAFFSAGGAFGALVMLALLGGGVAPAVAAGLFAGALAGVAFPASLGLAARKGTPIGRGPLFAVPRGMVLALGLLCFAAFLAEGAMLDWSALFLIQVRGVNNALGGAGYAVFAVSMTVCRFLGDRVVERAGRPRVLALGALLAALGMAVALWLPGMWAALAGFMLVGAGLSNMVPIIFSMAGAQRVMPANHAMAGVTALGYAGLLAGPAILGFVAEALTLSVAFGIVAGLLLLVAVAARFLRI